MLRDPVWPYSKTEDQTTLINGRSYLASGAAEWAQKGDKKLIEKARNSSTAHHVA